MQEPDDLFDFSDEEKTKPDSTDSAHLMSVLAAEVQQVREQEMQSLRSPGIVTATSERPTRPMLPLSIRWREEG